MSRSRRRPQGAGAAALGLLVRCGLDAARFRCEPGQGIGFAASRARRGSPEGREENGPVGPVRGGKSFYACVRLQRRASPRLLGVSSPPTSPTGPTGPRKRKSAPGAGFREGLLACNEAKADLQRGRTRRASPPAARDPRPSPHTARDGPPRLARGRARPLPRPRPELGPTADPVGRGGAVMKNRCVWRQTGQGPGALPKPVFLARSHHEPASRSLWP